MTTITRRLVEQDYDISDADVRELCETKLASGEVDKNLNEGYFKVLYSRTVQRIKLVHNPDVQARKDCLDAAHGGMYAIVLDVINGLDDCKPNHQDSPEVKKAKALRRNERSNYARSAKSAILKAIEAGISIEDKRPDMVGKTALEKEAKQVTLVQRSTVDQVAYHYNKLVLLMSKLSGENSADHAHFVTLIANTEWN